jgi:hypothetical protein
LFNSDPDAETRLAAGSGAGMTGFQEFDSPQNVEQNTAVRGSTPLFAGLFGIKANYISSASPQENDACRWWDVSCKVTKAASATGDFLQSTLLKVLVIVVIAALAGIFLMSYVQAKGGKLA